MKVLPYTVLHSGDKILPNPMRHETKAYLNYLATLYKKFDSMVKNSFYEEIEFFIQMIGVIDLLGSWPFCNHVTFVIPFELKNKMVDKE